MIFEKDKKNDERHERIKKMLGIAGGTAAGIAFLRHGKANENFNKFFSATERTVSKISKDIEETGFRSLDYEHMKSIVEKRITNNDSTFKSTLEDYVKGNIELDYNKGLASSLLNYKNLLQQKHTIKEQMADAIEKNITMQKFRDSFNKESNSFYKQLTVFTDEIYRKKSDFFTLNKSEDKEVYKAIESSFDDRLENSIFKKYKNELISVMETVLNDRENIQKNVAKSFNDDVQEKMTNLYKESIFKRFNKDAIKSINKDEVVTVKDFLNAIDDDKIFIKNNKLFGEGEQNNFVDFLRNLTEKDDRFYDLVLDNATLKKNNEKIYSAKNMQDIKHNVLEDFADSIPGKIFGVRTILENKKAPDFFYIPQGSYDSILGQMTGSKSGLTGNDFFKIGDKFYKYSYGDFEHIKEADNLYLMSGKHGTLNVFLNKIQGNVTEKNIDNKLDIGSSSSNVVSHFKNKFTKFNDPEWERNTARRLINDYKVYEKENVTEEMLRDFYKDISTINKFYNQKTFTPDHKSIKELQNVISKSSSNKLKILESDNVAEEILKSGFNIKNKNLEFLLKSYKYDRQSVSSMVQVGNLGEKAGKNVIRYNDLVKREFFKEILIQESLTHAGDYRGYAVTLGKIEKANIGGTRKENIKNLLNWTVLQHETQSYSSNLHQAMLLSEKQTRFIETNRIFKSDNKNPQSDNFLKKFRSDIIKFVDDNTSVFDSISKSDNSLNKAYYSNNWVTMRKAINPLEIISDINNNIKNASSLKDFGKQFIAGRNNSKNITTATFFPYHFFDRLISPLEEFNLGFSSKNTKNALDLVKNIGIKRILPVAGLLYGASYLNYRAEAYTGTSFSQAFLSGVARFNVGAKTIEGGLGLDNNIERSRDYNPIAQYWLGDHKNKEEYLDYLENGYSPVRKGRWWSFGSASEFRGGKISYWQPNALRRSYSHYKDINVYGSEDEKWKHSIIPTPRHPLSTLRYLANPYWLEDKHYWDRPYPVSGKMFSENTPWGIAGNLTIGNIIKPQKKMHKEELQGTGINVRTIIAKENQKIKERSQENRLVKLTSDGFTPISFYPESMPSLNESVFSIHTNKGKVTSASFKGMNTADNITTLNSNINIGSNNTVNPKTHALIANKSNMPSATAIKNAVRTSMIFNDDPNSLNATNNIINQFISMFSSNCVSSSQALNIVQGLNINTFNKASSLIDGIYNERRNLQNLPYINKNEQLENDYINKALKMNSKSDYIHELAYSTKQLSGIYGFLFDSILPPKHGYQLEQAGKMTSFVKSFWDSSIGGTGSEFMEIARRFFPHEDHNLEQINPIRNTMPIWVPERFQTGDPYTKITKGDARLPGKGYESLNKLHPDKYGRYGAFDRYKILADVSPLSEEYKTWKKIAKEEISNPALKKEMHDIEERAKEQNKQHDFYNYKFIGKKLATINGVVSKISNNGTFTIVGDNNVYSLAGLEVGKSKEGKSYLNDYLKAGMNIRLSFEDNAYRNKDSLGRISALINFTGESINRKIYEEKKGVEKENKETLADEYFKLKSSNITSGKIFEAIGHAPIPFIHNKFLKIDSPLESYKKEQIYGTSFSTWDHPIKGFIKPAFQQAWGAGPVAQGIALGSFALAQYAKNTDMSKGLRTAINTAFIATNPGAFTGGVLGFLPKMNLANKSSVWNAKNGANIGAIVGLTGYAFANLDNPFLSTGNFALAGMALSKQLKIDKFDGKTGALVGAAIGLGLSSMKISQLDIHNLNPKYIPKDTKKKWELEEYFDRLEYVKYMDLYRKASRKAMLKEHINVSKIVNKFEYNRHKNDKEISKLLKEKDRVEKYFSNSKAKEQAFNLIDSKILALTSSEDFFKLGEYSKAALAYKKAADSTIYGLSKFSNQSDIIRALPKYDRDFMMEFAKEKDPKARKKILKYVSPYKQKALKMLWHEDYKEVEDNKKFFGKHKLPGLFWSGWRPDVDLENVKMKTIKNEGMLLSDFGIYESQENKQAYKQAPEIKDMHRPSSAVTLQKDLLCMLNGLDLQFVDVSVEPSNKKGLQFITNLTRTTSYNIQQKVNNVLSTIF